MGKVYALLVGIDDYPANVGSLSGCVNDVDAFRDYLTSEVDDTELVLEVLRNADATRENVIGRFRSHLGQAVEGDVALFQYCGHGARWASAKPFRRFYPEAMDEGLVCIDSRDSGGYDLADKELAVLLAEVAKSEPHLVVILDCCHSGSGTRAVADSSTRRARRTHTVREERPLESYIDGYYSELEKKEGGTLFMPESRHLLMAACERWQQSYEDVDDDAKPHGLFSLGLLEVLSGAKGGASYQDLFVRCRREVNRRDARQTPQFEGYDGFDSSVGFLGREAAGSRRPYRVFFEAGGWQLEAGSINGLPSDPRQQVDLKVYPATGERRMLGTATTSSVGPWESSLKLDLEPKPYEDETFEAEVTTLPLPPVPVLKTGEANGLAAVEAALEKYPGTGIELTANPECANYEIRVRSNQLELWDRQHDRRIQGVEGVEAKSAEHFLRTTVAQVVAWERALALQNRGTQMRVADVDFWLTHGERDEVSTLSENRRRDPFEADRITINVPKGVKVPFKVWARNRSDEEWHFALFYFSPEYGVKPEANRALPSGDDRVELYEKEKVLSLADSVAEERLIFKLIVSTKKFDEFSLAIKDLGSSSRAVEDARDKHGEDWFAKSIEVKLLREDRTHSPGS